MTTPEQYTEHRTSLGDIYHELRVALHKYTTGEISPEAYNAKIEEMQVFLQGLKQPIEIKIKKFSPNQNV